MTATLPPLAAPDARELPTMTDPAWSDPGTVWNIAVPRYWRDRVDPAAHRLSHSVAVFGCPGCPAVACPVCSLPVEGCADPSAHRRVQAGAETTWREAA